MSKLSLVKPKEIILELGGKEYPLVFDFNAFAELEERFGSVQTAFEAMTTNPKMSDIVAIVKAGTASSEVELTSKELGKYLSPANVGEVMKIVNEAIEIAMPKEAEGKPVAKN